MLRLYRSVLEIRTQICAGRLFSHPHFNRKKCAFRASVRFPELHYDTIWCGSVLHVLKLCTCCPVVDDQTEANHWPTRGSMQSNILES